jgi:CDP-paratose 2-epimerase
MQGAGMRNVLVTGSAGLVGSEAVRFYNSRAAKVVGIDNNMRATFFGSDGDTGWRRAELEAMCHHYTHIAEDIRDFERMDRLIEELRPELIIHCAAQPSHDLAARVPMLDFETNALGTLNLLEATRRHAPDACFIFMSTNKVYGDAPNRITMIELPSRWDFADPRYAEGIDENLTIDQSTHSLFGASKVAADVLVQEYGRYFGMKTACFRGGCLTGTGHSGAELHGFLAYLIKTVALNRHYTILGYKGKQVRDQIHSRDVVLAFEAFRLKPRIGAVYNLGGGKGNSVSILEAIDRIEQLLGNKIEKEFSEQNRTGDHICYYSDMRRFRNDYPEWQITTTLNQIFDEFASDFAAAKAAAA